MGNKKFTFDAIGRDLYPEELVWAKDFNIKYSSRKDVVRLLVPSWLYEGSDNILKRVADVENFIHQMRFVNQPLQVVVSAKFFTKILNDEYVKDVYSFYVSRDFSEQIPEVGFIGEGKRWIRLCNTLFVEE